MKADKINKANQNMEESKAPGGFKKLALIFGIITLLSLFSFVYALCLPVHHAYAYTSVSPQEERDPAASAAAAEEQTTDVKMRDEQGRVSQLATDKHNPYNSQLRLQIDVGSEFADFEGSDFTEGQIVKMSPGGTISLPVVHARDGYYFVGWCQGGVPEEPTWDIFTDEVTMTDDISEGKDMTVYAIYADENGDGYCTCGAWTSGIYSERMDEIKANAAEYNKLHNLSSPFNFAFGFPWWIAFIVGLTLAFLIVIIYAKVIDSSLEKEENTEKQVNEDNE